MSERKINRETHTLGFGGFSLDGRIQSNFYPTKVADIKFDWFKTTPYAIYPGDEKIFDSSVVIEAIGATDRVFSPPYLLGEVSTDEVLPSENLRVLLWRDENEIHDYQIALFPRLDDVARSILATVPAATEKSNKSAVAHILEDVVGSIQISPNCITHEVEDLALFTLDENGIGYLKAMEPNMGKQWSESGTRLLQNPLRYERIAMIVKEQEGIENAFSVISGVEFTDTDFNQLSADIRECVNARDFLLIQSIIRPYVKVNFKNRS